MAKDRKYTWEDFGLCRGQETNDFFDNYENSPTFAQIIDDECLHCLVRKECFATGASQSRHGVWGGVFLTAGKPDKAKNAHKTQDIWDELEDKFDTPK